MALTNRKFKGPYVQAPGVSSYGLLVGQNSKRVALLFTSNSENIITISNSPVSGVVEVLAKVTAESPLVILTIEELGDLIQQPIYLFQVGGNAGILWEVEEHG